MLAWWCWREEQKRIFLAAFFFFMALGMLAKGPVAPFLAGAAIVVYAIVVRDLRLARKTLWLPGILLFCVVALPWYFAVQMRNPQFFREFILEQNLGRFSQNIYHHIQPFWYYLPVTALALVPWTVFAIAALVLPIRKWWPERKSTFENREEPPGKLALFACSWLIVPILFFSISQSKLPGYILLATPAGGLLLAIYLAERSAESKTVSKTLLMMHAVVASAPIVPGLLITYIVVQHRLPGGRPLLIAVVIAAVLCAGIGLTLVRRKGFRMLRFVTLIPVVLTIGAIIKLGSTSIDETLSARPMAREIASMETHPMLLAVYHVPRELEYGLTFYRNQLTFNYDWGRIPPEEHLLVAPESSQLEVAKLVPGRRVSYLGEYLPQHVDYFWVSAAAGSGH